MVMINTFPIEQISAREWDDQSPEWKEAVTRLSNLALSLPPCLEGRLGIGRESGETWLAGGAVRRAWMGLDPAYGDLDVFFNNETEFSRCVGLLSDWDVMDRHDDPGRFRQVKLEKSGNTPINLIFQNYQDVQQLLGSFDLTVCQFATNGVAILASQAALDDAEERRLRFVHVKSKLQVLKRLEKYVAMGFTMKPEDRLALAKAMGNLSPGDGSNPEYVL